MTSTARRKSTRRDYLAVVEAAYDLGASESDWVQGLAEAVQPIVDAGLGALVYTYDASDLAAVRIGSYGQAGGPEGYETACRALSAAYSPREAGLFYAANPPVELMRNIFAQTPPSHAVVNVVSSLAGNDAVGVRGHNPDGRGCIISAPSSQPFRLAQRTRSAMTRVALHLAAACRLRKTPRSKSSDEESDAIFSASGRPDHLRSEPMGEGARHELQAAVDRQLLGRRLRSEEPERALELWRALVAGRWSLVDHVDTDGKRFILARRNDPNLTHPAALEHDERLVALYTSWGHSNKLTSYELGLAPSRVSELLKGALRKLGLRSRAELVTIFTRGAGDERTPLRK